MTNNNEQQQVPEQKSVKDMVDNIKVRGLIQWINDNGVLETGGEGPTTINELPYMELLNAIIDLDESLGIEN